jgi:hypothetical protein
MKLDKKSVVEYLVDRKRKKFNVIQAMLTGFKDEINREGIKPFNDPNDFSTLNESYFDHATWVIRQADSLGLVIAIAPLWAGCCGEGYGGKGAVGPTSFMSTNGLEKCAAFGEYLGEKYKRFKNIIWIMGGDIDPFEDKLMIDAMAKGIKSKAPSQLMTFHPSSSHSSTDVWENPEWLDVTMTYTYFRGFNKAWTQDMPDVYELNWKEYAKRPVRPYFIGESTYEELEGEWGSQTQVRKQAYWSVLSGGIGNAYGTQLWNFPDDWRTYLDLPGANSFKFYVALFSKYPWYRMVPDPESRIITEGKGEIAQNSMAIAASDKKGGFIIVYLPSGRKFKINASPLKSDKVRANWFDPRTGRYVPIGIKSKSSLDTFESPDERDWVLVLESK